MAKPSMIQMVMYEGYFGGDPALAYTPSGKIVCNFRIGSSRSYTTASGEVKEDTTWLKCTAWGKLAEIIAEYCEKGSHAIVTGILRADENGAPVVFETKTGGHGANFEITVDKIRILKGKQGVTPVVEPEASSEDIPF